MFWRRFRDDEQGAIAVKFVIMAPIFLLGVAAAIEYSRAYQARGEIQSALDSATLAATRALAFQPGVTDAELTALAQAQIQASEAGRNVSLNCAAPVLTVDRVETRVSSTVSCGFSTIMPAGLSAIEIDRASASEINFDALDITFMLDVSGSMAGARLTNLKAAVNEAITIFLNQSRADVRIGFAPYATSVNAGPFAEAVTGIPDQRVADTALGQFTVDNSCVAERALATNQAFSDAPPAQEPLTRDPFQGPWTPLQCNPAEILPLTDNEALLRQRVEDLTAGGRTAGHLGIAWSWYLLSSQWDAVWPAGSKPLAPGEGRKALVIMTDGMFNTQYGVGNGDSRAQALALCDNLRDEGVLVFSVGFQAPGGVIPTLRDCATTPNLFYEASSGSELIEAYRAIAEELSTHNLVQ